MELGARMGIGPGGFEPPYPDPKSGVLPLDEGPATLWRLKLQSQGFRWKAPTFPLLPLKRLASARARFASLRTRYLSKTLSVSHPHKSFTSARSTPA